MKIAGYRRKTTKGMASLWVCRGCHRAAVARGPQNVEAIDAELRAKIDHIATGVMEVGAPSVSIAVVKGDKLVYTRLRQGPHRCRQAGHDRDALFDRVDFQVVHRVGNEITIRQILSHTSGYQDYTAENYIMNPMLNPETTEQPGHAGEKPLDFEPRTKWHYSNNELRNRRTDRGEAERPKADAVSDGTCIPAAGYEKRLEFRRGKLPSSDATAYYRQALGPLWVAPGWGNTL